MHIGWLDTERYLPSLLRSSIDIDPMMDLYESHQATHSQSARDAARELSYSTLAVVILSSDFFKASSQVPSLTYSMRILRAAVYKDFFLFSKKASFV